LNQPAIVKHCHEKTFHEGNTYCVFDNNLINDFTPAMLSSGYWQQQKAIVGSAQGRGTTYFVIHQNKQWVLRHYYRGGLMGKINKDSYIFHSWQKTRAVKEFELLNNMRLVGLPVPQPVACRIIKKGLFYHADLLTSRIENAEDLVSTLQKKPLESLMWYRIGVMIKQFHQKGIYHHDLNCHNILLDNTQKVWLIDFDRCEQRDLTQSNNGWPQKNIDRLLRSFNKEQLRLNTFYWNEQDWYQLIKGYQS
jgi:3-deoxy-D-manno-octulosonic acid kinase